MKEVHRKVLQLRESGKSYPEIREETGLAKSTISFIVSKYFPVQKNRDLFMKHMRELGQTEEFKAGQSARRRAADALYQEERESRKAAYLERLCAFPDQNLIYYVAGLYAGEGNHANRSEFSLCNSNANIVRIFLRFLREVLGLKEEEFSVSLALHASMSREECVVFWEKSCSHPVNFVMQHDNRPQKKVHKHNKRAKYYGTLSIRVIKPNGLKLALKEYEY